VRVAVVIYPGFDELDALGPYEVLQMAASECGWEVRLVSLGGPSQVTASNAAVVHSQAGLRERWDLVVVPGGGWAQRQGAFQEAQRGELPAALADLHGQGATMASVCTGAMLLAAARLTQGRPAVTHHNALDDLRASGAEIVQARVVDDGDIVTSGGITSGIDLGLWLLERFWGRTLADRIAQRLEHVRVGEVFLGPRAQPVENRGQAHTAAAV
jgi:transcriptional regulator GlxA family with amidase domain